MTGNIESLFCLENLSKLLIMISISLPKKNVDGNEHGVVWYDRMGVGGTVSTVRDVNLREKADRGE